MTTRARLAEIAREEYEKLRRKNPWQARDIEKFAIAVALRDREEQQERVCPSCGKSEPGNDGLCPDPRQPLIYRHEFERREGRT